MTFYPAGVNAIPVDLSEYLLKEKSNRTSMNLFGGSGQENGKTQSSDCNLTNPVRDHETLEVDASSSDKKDTDSYYRLHPAK